MSESRLEFGEGSNNGSRVYKGVGIDISKEGILEATKKSKEIIWCVADLAKIPLLDKNHGYYLKHTGHPQITVNLKELFPITGFL